MPDFNTLDDLFKGLLLWVLHFLRTPEGQELIEDGIDLLTGMAGESPPFDDNRAPPEPDQQESASALRARISRPSRPTIPVGGKPQGD